MTRALIGDTTGEVLDLEHYLEDYEKAFWSIRDLGFWKLERQQTFREPGFGSWEAFAAGHWEESLALLERERPAFEEYFAKVAAHGIDFCRVRVVDEPITPYLQWELHVLMLRAQCGEKVRVVGSDAIASFESAEPLPELITLGGEVMYRIIYDETGVLDSAERFTGPTVGTVQTFVEGLHATGEDLETFFAANVLTLDQPAGEQRSAG